MDLDVSSSMPGRMARLFSMGFVTFSSTSHDEAPGYPVTTVMTGFCISG